MPRGIESSAWAAELTNCTAVLVLTFQDGIENLPDEEKVKYLPRLHFTGNMHMYNDYEFSGRCAARTP